MFLIVKARRPGNGSRALEIDALAEMLTVSGGLRRAGSPTRRSWSISWTRTVKGVRYTAPARFAPLAGIVHESGGGVAAYRAGAGPARGVSRRGSRPAQGLLSRAVAGCRMSGQAKHGHVRCQRQLRTSKRSRPGGPSVPDRRVRCATSDIGQSDQGAMALREAVNLSSHVGRAGHRDRPRQRYRRDDRPGGGAARVLTHCRGLDE